MIDLNNIYIHGRYYYDGKLYLYNTASGIEFNFKGKKVTLSAKAEIGQTDKCWLRAIIDNDEENAIELKFGAQNQEICLFSSKNEEKHNIKVLKVSEAIESHICIDNLGVEGIFLDKPVYENTFLVFGDSTVSAFGNLGSVDDEKVLYDTDGLKGFAHLAARAFNASMNSLNGSGWGLEFSLWTTPKHSPLLYFYDKMAPLVDIKYDLKVIKPKLVIISLGTNDSYYCLEPEIGENSASLYLEFKNAYHQLLTNIKRDFDDIPIIMIYGIMKEKHNYELMHEVFLENKDKFNLYEALIEGDGKGVSNHPSKDSHQEIANKLITMIKGIINE